ncbi:AlkA N-terminal domain-containing protein [Ferrimonas pelagia]|uniref:DNA-3-methyladenine glycosylase II n=1 Tax=Ferrimonas pelagia TaxID=1177826 RepID=A0ABP9EJT0_9GAMM
MARDSRFDGRFLVGVRSTGIYCRPICRVKAPLEKNVSYFSCAAQAELQGLRPCLRCRPELAPPAHDWRVHQPKLQRAMALLCSQQITGVVALADACFLSERQLRRLFQQHLGVSPLQALSTHRLLQAKQLLTDTRLPITDIAYAAGFSSIRRFNDAFAAAYRLSPSRFRKDQGAAMPAATIQLRLCYRPPLDFSALLPFFAHRAINGLEEVRDGIYRRRLGPEQAFTVQQGEGDALLLTLEGIEPGRYAELQQRVRRMWDLDADLTQIHQTLDQEPILRAISAQWPGLRLPSYWDGWETLLRAIVGQQISVAGAITILGRLVTRHEAMGGFGLPTPEALARMDLTAIGMPGARVRTLHAAAQMAMETPLDGWPDPQATAQKLAQVKGIGPWTVAYWCLRSGADPDSFPANDMVLLKAARQLGLAQDAKALTQRAQPWAPWRGYAASLLWQSTMTEQEQRKP